MGQCFRWEKKTLPFLRTSEFLWQEGHTAHEDEAGARKRTLEFWMNMHVFAKNFSHSSVQRTKTPSERFAGAVDTYPSKP